ncbi:MAG: hypothetical protein ABUS79_06275 [Pseudomonadota bacterium]
MLCAAVVTALWACGVRKLAPPVGGPRQVVQTRFHQSVNRDLDLLFVVDDSISMEPLQTKMAARLRDFMEVLKGVDGGLPNLHVAVISTSLGAGRFGDVGGCGNGTAGNSSGVFQHRAACTMLHAGEKFISSVADARAPNGRINNFDGDIADAFSCIAQLGQGGCGFEHQFENTKLALMRAQNASDSFNGGFLRPDAYLAIVMVTNEDDCSVPEDSVLLDPRVQTLTDVSSEPGPLNGVALGVLQSYRCNEFGHRCGGMKPPHNPLAAPTPLDGCTSAEDGVLVKVSDFVAFLKTLKPDRPDRLLMAALAGPTGPYVIETVTEKISTGALVSHPAIGHSCVEPTADPLKPEYGDPAIRVKQWLDAFPNSVLQSICADDFRQSMQKIAEAISNRIGAPCLEGDIATNRDNAPDCDVTERVTNASASSGFVDKTVRFCPPGRTGTDATHPCWELVASPRCAGGQMLQLCYDVGCTQAARPTNTTDALVSCALAP